MNAQPTRPRPKTAILAEINAIPHTVAGTLTEKRHLNKDGSVSVYHQLQRWTNGKNTTTYVPKNKLERVRQGIENARQRNTLLEELDEAGLADALADETTTEPNTKKKHPKPGSKSRTSSKKREKNSAKSPSTRTRT